MPGHTLWLRGGIFTGQFYSNLQGTATQPIIVQSFLGKTAILNGNTVSYTPIINPKPILLSNNSSLTNRIKKFYWSLEPEQRAEFYERARNNPNLVQNGLTLINLPKPAVLNVYGGYVHFIKFEITCLGNFEREFTMVNYFQLGGIHHHGNLALGNKFIELVVKFHKVVV